MIYGLKQQYELAVNNIFFFTNAVLFDPVIHINMLINMLIIQGTHNLMCGFLFSRQVLESFPGSRNMVFLVGASVLFCCCWVLCG